MQSGFKFGILTFGLALHFLRYIFNSFLSDSFSKVYKAQGLEF